MTTAWKPEVFVQGKWSRNAMVLATEAEALLSAQELMSRWMMVEDVRAVEVEGAIVNYKIVDNELFPVAAPATDS